MILLALLLINITGVLLQGLNHNNSNAVTCNCGWKNTVNGPSLNIIGGNIVEDYEYPFIASLIPLDGPGSKVNCGYMHCGATILTMWHLATAAHCIEPDQKYAIVASASKIQTCSEGHPQIREVADITIHPGFSKETFLNDIAVLKLSSSLDFGDKTVGPACLPSMYRVEPLKENDQLLAMGWGATDTEPEGSDVLLQTTLTVMDFDKCVEFYKTSAYYPRDRNTQFCTYDVGKGICWGDSGGPLLSIDQATGLYFQRGVVSYGPESCSTKYPSVHTRLAPYVKWLMETANQPMCIET